MRFAGERQTRPSSRLPVYVLAVALPIVSSVVTQQVQGLHAIPLALSFISVAFLAGFGGLAPALFSVLITACMRYLGPAFMHVRVPFNSAELLRMLTLSASAAVISFITSSQRRTSAALRQALATVKEQSRALVDAQQASKCASWTYDSRDRTRWYPGGYEVFGIPFVELEKRSSPIDLIYPEDQPGVREAVKEMITSRGPLHIEYRVLWPDGKIHWSEARGTPMESDPHLWRGVTFDITERKLAEAALIRSEKLAAMGRLASTVAHEINNPLEAVTNLLYLALRDPLLTPTTAADLAAAERELARVGEITRLTLGFIKTSTTRRDILIADGIEDVISIFRHRFEAKEIQVERRCEPGVMVNIAPQELRQIVTNLISNAVDAAAGPGARVNISIDRQDGLAVMRVEDNGTGISDANLRHVFDPFFSTKEDTGTGIGLWVTRELVEKNGGTISAQSGNLPDGMRTCFRIEFPGTGVSQVLEARETSHAAVS